MSFSSSIKGLFVAFIALLTTFPLVSFAQQNTETNLGDILIRFCNDEEANKTGGTKTLELEAQAGNATELCMFVSNTGPNDVDVLLNFVDGTITNDVNQKKACQPEGTKGNFGKYVEMQERQLTVPAGKTLQAYASITFPAGVAGMKYGCITSQIVGQNESDTGMFKIVSRRANFIDILVEGNIVSILEALPLDKSIPTLGDSNTLRISQDTFTEQYMAHLSVENKGNIAQDVNISPTISSRFQGMHILTGVNKKILPGETNTFSFILDDGIPLWKGSMQVDLTMTATPVIDFVSDSVTEADKAAKTMNYTSSFFLIPRAIIIAILILLVILWIRLSRNSTPHLHKKSSTPAKKEKKDNLTKLTGITKKIQTILRDAGIDSFAVLATSKVGDIRNILKQQNIKTYTDPKIWKKEATLAKNKKRKELTALQGK